MDVAATLSLLQEHHINGLVPSRDAVRIGGFLALFHPDDPIFFANLAYPVDAIADGDVEALIAAYVSKGRDAWLEFALELWPDVPAKLEAAGLELKHRIPIMVLRRQEWERRSSGARRPNSQEVGEFRRVGNEAFDITEPDPDSRVEQTRLNIASGRTLAAMVECDGRIVSVGQAVGTSHIREVVGLATVPEYRKRGFCSQVIDALLAQHFDAGGEVAWLTPIDEVAGRVYERAGFRSIGTQMVYGKAS